MCLICMKALKHSAARTALAPSGAPRLCTEVNHCAISISADAPNRLLLGVLIHVHSGVCTAAVTESNKEVVAAQDALSAALVEKQLAQDKLQAQMQVCRHACLLDCTLTNDGKWRSP